MHSYNFFHCASAFFIVVWRLSSSANFHSKPWFWLKLNWVHSFCLIELHLQLHAVSIIMHTCRWYYAVPTQKWNSTDFYCDTSFAYCSKYVIARNYIYTAVVKQTNLINGSHVCGAGDMPTPVSRANKIALSWASQGRVPYYVGKLDAFCTVVVLLFLAYFSRHPSSRDVSCVN